MSETTTILVVDDEALPRTLLATSLRAAGYAVEEASGGAEALSRLRAAPCSTVLLDLMMPVMDGFAVLRQMKADRRLREIPVIVVSASDDMESVVRCIRMGAADHLSKPIDPVLLQARVRAALALGKIGQAGPTPAQGDGSRPAAPRAQHWERREDEPVEGLGVWGFLRAMLRWSRPYRRRVALFTLLIMVALGLEAALPMGFGIITDEALANRDLPLLMMILGALLVAFSVSAITQIGADFVYTRLATELLNDLRFNMFRHLQRLSAGFYSRVPAADLTSRFTSDLAAVENTVLFCLPITVGQVVLVVFSFAFLLSLEWKLALAAMFGVVLSYYAERRVERPAVEADALLKREQAHITAVLQENVGLHAAIKAFGLQAAMIEQFKHQMVDFLRTAARASFLSYLTESVPRGFVGFFGLLTFGASATLAYFGYLTIGQLISFQILLTELLSAWGGLMWSAPHLLRAGGGMQKIEELLAEKSAVVDAPDAVALQRPSQEIAFRSVRFGHAAEHADIEDLSLAIRIGTKVQLIGPSGSGKTTALHLLMRLFDPSDGAVTIDGTDVRTVTQDSLRQQLGVVFQESLFFQTSIRENIRLGRPGATDEEVVAAARAVGMTAAVEQLPMGFDTPVGERGALLSAALRQRLALARAIISDPPILLLDEVAAGLDAAAAAELDDVVERIGRGRTVVSASHRLEGAPRMDALFLLQEGRVVESGRHEELLARGDAYARAWRGTSSAVSSARAAGADAVPGARASVEEEAMTLTPLAPATILVVDDELLTRMLLRTLLEPGGHRVLEAADGEGALELMGREDIDVVLLDLNMPGIDGFEVCRRLRARPDLAHLPVVILTSSTDRETRAQALEAGCDDFLFKPVDDLELRARVRNMAIVKRYRGTTTAATARREVVDGGST